MPTETIVQARARKARERARKARAANVSPAAFQFEEARIYCGGLSPAAMGRLIQKKILKPNKHLGRLLFSKVHLDDFLAQTRS